ncbi:chitin synthesis regulation, resistance to congo red-domain-containing protein [Tuber brumale]|nr:chitin synthesis regulation, resistance to congo red-domain-containing protein [Tuber brumale]
MSEGVTDKIERGFSRVVRRDYYDRCYYDCYSSWDNWGRWVALTVIVVFFFLVVACCGLITSRRRRRAGMQPVYGTAWMAPPKYTPHDVHQFQTYPPQHYPPLQSGPYAQYYTPTHPAPAYSPAQQNHNPSTPGLAGGNYHAAGMEDPQGQQGQYSSPPPAPLGNPEPVAHVPVDGHQTGETVLTHSTGSNNPYSAPPSGMPQAHIGGKV